MNKVYQEYFEMLGFESAELEKQLPRIEKALTKLHVTEDDIKICQKRLRFAVDLSLKGMRMLLRLFFKEMVNLVLAREEHEKVIYTFLPGVGGSFVAPVTVGHPEVYAQCVDMVTALAMGNLFNKQVPCLEAGEKYLPVGNFHCGGYRTLLGALKLDAFAKPDIIISPGNYCDEGPKISSFIADMLNVPIIYVDGYQDFPTLENNPTPRYIDFVAEEMERAYKDLEKLLGYEISEETKFGTLMATADPHSDFSAIQQLMFEKDPVPMSTVEYMFAFTVAAITCSPDNVPLRAEALKTLHAEIEDRAARGEGPLKKGTLRILETVPSFSDPVGNHIYQECGLQVIGSDMPVYPPEAGFDPDLEGCDNFYKILAKTVMAMPVSAGCAVRKQVLSALVKKYNFDGIVIDPSFSCRLGFADSQIMRNYVEKELHIPVMILEHDTYDPRFFTPGQLRTRIETFAEQVKVFKESKQLGIQENPPEKATVPSAKEKKTSFWKKGGAKKQPEQKEQVKTQPAAAPKEVHTLAEAFDSIKTRFQDPKIKKELADFHSTVECTFLAEKTKAIFIIDGDKSIDIKINTGDDSAPLKSEYESEQTVIDIANGKLGAMGAYTKGKLKVVKGEMKDLMKLRKLIFP